MILLDPSTSELAQSLVDAAGRLVDEATITKSFVDSFAPKATSTMLKRTTHLWSFCIFVTDKKLGSPLEFQEPVVYGYLNSMRDSGRGATAIDWLLAWGGSFDSLPSWSDHIRQVFRTSKVRVL